MYIQLLRQTPVLHGQDLDGKQRGVDGPVNGNSGHRDPGRHLYRRQERVNAVQRIGFQWDADDRQGGLGSQRARQMGGHARGGDEHAEAVFPGVPGELGGLEGGAVGGIDVDLTGHTEGAEGIGGLARDGQVAGAAHDDGGFFHRVPPFAQLHSRMRPEK